MKRHAELVSASVNLTTDSEPGCSSTKAGIDDTQVHLVLFSRNAGLLPQDDRLIEATTAMNRHAELVSASAQSIRDIETNSGCHQVF